MINFFSNSSSKIVELNYQVKKNIKLKKKMIILILKFYYYFILNILRYCKIQFKNEIQNKK